MPDCLARLCLRCPVKPSCLRAFVLSRRLILFHLLLFLRDRFPSSSANGHAPFSSFFVSCRPSVRPSVRPSSVFSLSPFHSLGLSEESRPLVFLLFPSDLRLLLVITTNLSRINSPSGINSSTVQAEKEKVIARGRRAGTGNPTHPVSSSPRALTFSRASGIRVATLSPSSKMKGTEESRADRKRRNCMKLERNATSRSQLKEIRSKS